MAAGATETLKEKAGLTKKKPTFYELLEAMKPQIALALPRHLTPERMIRIALTCCRLNPRLLECTPESLIAAIMISSQLGLEPGVMGQSFLVPFRHGKDRDKKDIFVCQLIPGWLGILDLVNRSGKATAWTGAVYAGDEFDWSLGDKPYLKHKPSGDESKLTHVYAVARPVSSQWPILEVWTIEKIWKHRDRVNKVGADHYSYNWPEQYARKIPLLQTLKYVPKSIELQAALSLDTAAEGGGQALTIKDVPSIVEGTGAFSEPESLPEPKPEKTDKKAAAIDEICASCGTLNGHTLDCKFHPRNELRVAPQQEQKPETSSNQQVAQQEPTPAEKANPFQQQKKLVRIKKVEKKQLTTGNPFYKIAALEESGAALTLVCFHLNRGLEIYDRYQENGLAVFLVREKRDKKTPYFEVDEIISLAGKDYRDGKRIEPDPPAPDPKDEEW